MAGWLLYFPALHRQNTAVNWSVDKCHGPQTLSFPQQHALYKELPVLKQNHALTGHLRSWKAAVFHTGL